MSTRRLAAIGVVDVAGYSRMMAADEEGTLAVLKAHRAAGDPIIYNRGGRIVKGTGDGMLIEVPSVVEGVRAAVELQNLMVERNETLPEARRMQYRIGINLGDVIVDDDGDIYGDGVNVAARIEALADPGGICVSDSVYDQVRDRLDLRFDDLGHVEVKNIPKPIRVWKVRSDEAIPATGSAPSTTPQVLATVAVLPFNNMSADPDQEYFADGITEDLITTLSHYPELRVVARNSTFAYKGQALDVRRIAREIDATHVLEGSVRRAGNKVRVTAQLIEAESGHHIWAERYDRELEDIFDLQDEIVSEVAGHIRPNLVRSEGAKRASIQPIKLTAWDLLLRARHEAASYTDAAIATAIETAERALELDPSLPGAHSHLAGWWVHVAHEGFRIPDRNAWQEVEHHAEAAMRADAGEAHAHAAMSWAESDGHKHPQAVASAQKAVALDPYHASAHMSLGRALFFAGRANEAIDPLNVAWRLGGHDPWKFHVATNLAFATYLDGNYNGAIAWATRGLRDAPRYLQLHSILAAAHGQLGRPDEANPHLEQVLGRRPGLTAEKLRPRMHWSSESDIEHYMEGLVKAGLPEAG